MNKERVIQKFKNKQKHIEASRKWGKKRLEEWRKWRKEHKLISSPIKRVYPEITLSEGMIEVKPLLCFANFFAARYKRMIDAKKRRQYNRGFRMRRRNR